MTKYELLNLLYAERSRLEKTYARPGWTLWAIGAAIASLMWLFWELAEKCKDWQYAVIIFLLAYLVIMIVEVCLSSFKTAFSVPVWKQGQLKDKITIIFHTTFYIGLIISQLCIIPTSFHTGLYWVAVVFIAIFALLMVFALINSYKGYAVSEKNAKWSFLLALPMLPTIILFAMYLHGCEYNPYATRVGVVASVIVYLTSLIPIGEKKQFSQIDRLITRVLYESQEVDELKVLQEMELYTIGLRYGKYLSKTKLSDFLQAIAQLTHSTFLLIKRIEDGDENQIDKIIIEGQKNYLTLSRLSSSFLSQIKVTYRNEDMDVSLTPILKAGQVGVETMIFWSRVCSIKKSSPSNWREQIDAAYQETVGQPEIQDMIADRNLWLQS